jgi:uncharacterized protein with HEPN domain
MQQHIKNDMLYLLRMMEAAQKIQLYAISFTDWESFYFSNDQLEFNACLNQLGQIGEQAKKLSHALTDKYCNISWQKIKGFRNRIIHEYIGIDTENVFQIIQVDVPELHRQIIPIIINELKDGNFDRAEFEIAKTSPYLKHIDFTLF